MADLTQQLIWIGAGSASQPTFNFADYAKVTLIDAREEATQALAKQFSSKNIQVINKTIATTSEKCTLQRYNLPEFTALSAATGLKQLFPGLKGNAAEQLTAQGIAELITELKLTTEQHTLVLDVPDIALPLLQKLQSYGQLGLFSTIYVQYATSELYEGMASQQQLLAFFKQHYFTLSATDNSDPDLPRYTFTLDAAVKTIAKLSQQIKSLTEQLAVAESQLSLAQQQAEQANNAKTDLTKQLDASQQQLVTQKQHAEQANSAKAELAKQLEVSQQQLAAQNQQAEQANAANAELAKQLEASQQQLAALKQQTEQANLAKAELTKKLDASQQQLAAQKQQAEQKNATKADLAKQLEANQQQLATQKQQAEQANSAKAELAKQLESCQQQLAAQKQQAEQANIAKVELAKQLEASQQQAAVQKQQAEQANVAKADLVKQLEASQQQLAAEVNKSEQQKHIAQLLDEKIDALSKAKTEELNKAVSHLKYNLTSSLGNTAKQIEAFISINNYLEHGIKPLNFHGWPISPDIGLYLTGLIDANNYDVIIEFGSGTSTVLMAKALRAKHGKFDSPKLVNLQPTSASVSTSADRFQDLPSRVVTFEHNSHYHDLTLENLKDNNIGELVDLVHAPLVDFTDREGNEYLYYSCTDKLNDLACVFKGRKANILVLVDGPPGATNKNARFPALPHLLKSLTTHAFTIVMDDANRQEEKDVLKLWLNILEARSVKHDYIEVPSEKGLAVVKIY